MSRATAANNPMIIANVFSPSLLDLSAAAKNQTLNDIVHLQNYENSSFCSHIFKFLCSFIQGK